MTSLITQRIEQVETRIGAALARCGRKREDVTLVAVTKVFPAETILAAHEAGLRHFGENYVQEFEGKHAAVRDLAGARFHFIGHLQSNKAKRAAELFQVVETVDSPKLARRLNEHGQSLDVMIEVKLSEEESKRGADPSALPELLDTLAGLPNLRLRGLMTMPPWLPDPAASRPYFVRLRELGERYGLAGLSMGMSHDFEVAIEEGATCIRVGSALFGPRPKR